MIYVALCLNLIGFLSTYLSKKIDYLWMKFAWLLSFIIPNILLSIVFYGFLYPIAMISKLFKAKTHVKLKNDVESLYVERNISFDKTSFEKPW